MHAGQHKQLTRLPLACTHLPKEVARHQSLHMHLLYGALAVAVHTGTGCC
jgi:hypothetical protein